jgi:dTDP-4-amino-4,6-dideoxygalactose transaminase
MELIHHTFGPLADSDQRRLALKHIRMPWHYRNTADVRSLEHAIGERFHGEAVAFGSCRESLLALLRTLQPKPDEEVIVQGYTCVVVPNAVHAAGMVCVYADIERDTLNLDLEAVEEAITPKTRAIICQHTFGIPADTKALRALCDKHSLMLIEDCAHILPDAKGPAAIGHLGDAMIMSFGRDKAISGVSGGAVLTRNKNTAAALRSMQEVATEESLFRIFAYLLYPILYSIARPLFGIGLGKALLLLAAKLKLLIPSLTKEDKNGDMPNTLHRMPGACAVLALQQLNKLETINHHRRTLTKLYIEHGTSHDWPLLTGVSCDFPVQKFPLFIRGAEAMRRKLKKNNVHLFDGWTGCVICPSVVDLKTMGYEDGLDPNAESICEQIITFPTHPGTSQAQAKKLCTLFDKLLTPNS